MFMTSWCYYPQGPVCSLPLHFYLYYYVYEWATLLNSPLILGQLYSCYIRAYLVCVLLFAHCHPYDFHVFCQCVALLIIVRENAWRPTSEAPARCWAPRASHWKLVYRELLSLSFQSHLRIFSLHAQYNNNYYHLSFGTSGQVCIITLVLVIAFCNWFYLATL